MKCVMRKAGATTLLVLLFLNSQAQSSPQKIKQEMLTGDSLATGNWKDVLTSFFQLSFDKLISQRKELNFQSNPFAVLLRANPDANVDVNYKKYRVLRKLNFGFGIGLDSSYRFNGFNSGLRYAVINQRDSTVSKWLFEKAGKGTYRTEIIKLIRSLGGRIRTEFPGTENIGKRDSLEKIKDNLSTERSVPFKKLDTTFQRLAMEVAKDNNLMEISEFIAREPDKYLIWKEDSIISDLKKQVRNAPLLTLSLSDTTYKDQFFFSNIVFKTEFLKGIGKYKPGGNWELNLQAGVNFVDDSTRKGRNLNRSLFRFEPGINFVFRNQANDQSWFETKFSGSYIHNFGTLYKQERRDSLTFNATLRVRIIGDIWIPLEIKYDPRKGNVFGFLNVRFNFSGQAKKPATQS